MIIRDGAGIAASSQGSGEGGNIFIEVGTLTLDNKAFISGETATNQGGNITLSIQDKLFLQNKSQITATAGTEEAGGDGGNITINAPFILAFPDNNEITANAFEGNGGNIQIFTNAIFGSQFLEVTASSAFGVQGVVDINTPNVDPSQGLVELSENPVDVAKLIEQNFCRLGSGSEFIITGRGGLPASPNETLRADAPWVDLRLEENQQPSEVNINRQTTMSKTQRRIIQAQGWITTANGTVLLTSQGVTATSQGIWLHPTDCQILRQHMSHK
ncbi:MAG: S-layer family protein [Moorea sp. SIO2B7]|nr:S-layer family protein [Moorena sp. SIO2B7]